MKEKSPKEIELQKKEERTLKEKAENLRWDSSPLQPAAALVNHDGSKRGTDKCLIRSIIKEIFSNTPSVPEVSSQSPNTSTQCITVPLSVFCHETSPENEIFDVISVDAQHTLWDNLGVTNGIDCVKKLGNRYWNSLFMHNEHPQILYWNYDLGDVVKKTIPKGLEQDHRDTANITKVDLNPARIMGDKKAAISDALIVKEWDYVRATRDVRNQIASYVAQNAHHYLLKQDKALVINSEAIEVPDGIIPIQFNLDDGEVRKIPLFNRANSFAEGEGASVGHLVKGHANNSWLVLSTDTDALFYCLMAGVQRRRTEEGIFPKAFFLQLNSRQAKSGVAGKINNIISEFWDINNLIYAIEKKLPALSNPVLDIIVVFLAAGSDLTEKWYHITHKAFLEAWILHSDFIKDLVKVESDGHIHVDLPAYRRLVHAVWVKKGNPRNVSYHQIREESLKKKDIRQHLPNEDILRQLGRRISGVFLYMFSYLGGNEVDWESHGFEFDSVGNKFVPKYFTPITTNNPSCTKR